MTGCECQRAGWCERHQCDKTPHWHRLCQTRPNYFRLWERGCGPGQSVQPVDAPDCPPGIELAFLGFAQNLLRASKLPKPWREHSVTVCIPHLDTPEMLGLSVRSWLLQEDRPFVLVVDTGSRSPTSLRLLGRLERTPGVEVARLGMHTQMEHPSDRVTIALDYAMARCPTDYLLMTHVDLMPRHRRLVQKLLDLCNESQPVAGWEMSPRGPGDPETGRGYLSDGVPGHVCTMLYMPVMDRIGAGWSIRRAHHAFGLPRRGTEINGWPDTEVCLGRLLEQHQLIPLFLGRETNDENQETGDWLHARSLTAHTLVGGRMLPRHVDALWAMWRTIVEWEQEDLKCGDASVPPYSRSLGLLVEPERQESCEQRRARASRSPDASR